MSIRNSFSWLKKCAATAALMLLSATLAPAAPIPELPTGQLQVMDVQNIIANAVTQAVHDKVNVVVAVVDREGNVLGVFDMNGAPTASVDDVLGLFTPPTTQAVAIQKARTAAYLSSDQNGFSTRTALQITAKHFPPNVNNTGPGPLFGLPMSSLPCGDVQKNGSGLTGALGGIPLYINHAIAGGIGIDGARARRNPNLENQSDDEVIALAGARRGYGTPASIVASNLLVNGIRFEWVGSRKPNNLTVMPFASLPGALDAGFPTINAGSPPPVEVMEAGVPGEWRVPPTDSAVSNLTAADVTKLVDQSLESEKLVRAAIRLPVGIPSRMQVGVTDIAGNVIGLFRTNDATMFSLDIVIQKGRTVTAFSNPNDPNGYGKRLRDYLNISEAAPLAVTSRTIEFLGQPFYPPGINGRSAGPLFCDNFALTAPSPPAKKPGLKASTVLPYCLQQQLYFMTGATPPCGVAPPNGITLADGFTLFPGSTPLYKSGVLVGGLGISGDGVDQDDFVTNAGGAGFLPPNNIRATNIKFRGAFLPFFKFPRHPLLD